MSAARRRQPRLGDVFAVPLPNGRFAHARYYADATLGVYAGQRAREVDLPAGRREVVLFLSVHLDNLLDGDWPLVGVDPFEEGEETWPPPRYIQDFLTGEPRIYERGTMRPAEGDAWRGLEEAAVWEGAAARQKIAEATAADGAAGAGRGP